MAPSKEVTAAARADVEAAGERLGKAGTGEIDAFVQSGRLDLLLEALAQHLRAEPDERTYNRLEKALVPLVGFEGFALICWLASLTGHSVPAELERLGLSTDATAAVGRILALFGPQISEATYRSPTAPFQADEWRTVQRDVLLDVETGTYTIVARIVKRSGEVIALQSSASSMLRLTRVLVRILRKVDDPDAFESDDVEAFLETADEFRVFLTREGATPPAETEQSEP